MKLITCCFFILSMISCESSPAQKPIGKEIDSTALNLRKKAIMLSLEYSKDKSNFYKAIQLLDSAVKIAPDFYAAYSNKANFHLILGQKTEALAAINSVIRIKPSSPMVWMSKGSILEKMDKLDSAKYYYLKASQALKKNYEDSNDINDFSNYVISLKVTYDNKTALDMFYKDKDKFKDQDYNDVAWINFVKILEMPRDQFLHNTKGPYASTILIR